MKKSFLSYLGGKSLAAMDGRFSVAIEDVQRIAGPVLCTHFGVSGPLVLSDGRIAVARTNYGSSGGALLFLAVALSATRPLGEFLADVGQSLAETRVISRSDYLLTQFRVLVTYVRLLFMPVAQNLDYAYPIATSLFDPAVCASLFFLLGLLACAVALLMRAGRGGERPLVPMQTDQDARNGPDATLRSHDFSRPAGLARPHRLRCVWTWWRTALRNHPISPEPVWGATSMRCPCLARTSP